MRAGDAETIADIDKAAAALNAAFEKDDVGAIKALTTPDHIAVTPYYDGPQSLDDQAASLPDLEHSHTNVSGVSVILLGPDTALRSYTAELKGSFKGRTHPRRAFISAIWVKQNGAWVEKFYQATALRHGHGQRGACRKRFEKQQVEHTKKVVRAAIARAVPVATRGSSSDVDSASARKSLRGEGDRRGGNAVAAAA